MSQPCCALSGKLRYALRADAQRAADAQMARWKRPTGRAEKRPGKVRVYRCHHCKDWHLTSSQFIPAVHSNRLRRDIRRGLIEQQ